MGAVGGLRTSPRMMGGFFALYQTDGREKGRIDVVWGCLSCTAVMRRSGVDLVGHSNVWSSGRAMAIA
jgi:hypothetical protein